MADSGGIIGMGVALDVVHKARLERRGIHLLRGDGKALPARGRGELALIRALSHVGKGFIPCANKGVALVNFRPLLIRELGGVFFRILGGRGVAFQRGGWNCWLLIGSVGHCAPFNVWLICC